MSQDNLISNKNKKWLLIGVVLLASLLCGRAVYCDLLICAPNRNILLRDLAVPEEFFPSQSVYMPMHPPSEKSGALENGVMMVTWDGPRGLAVLVIDRFGTNWGAEQRFNQLRKMDDTDYQDGINLNVSSRGIPSFWGCGISEFGGYRCFYQAVYEEFYLSFNAVIDDGMTYHQFESIVAFIDEEISKSLSD